jgi:hypothetical protein
VVDSLDVMRMAFTEEGVAGTMADAYYGAIEQFAKAHQADPAGAENPTLIYGPGNLSTIPFRVLLLAAAGRMAPHPREISESLVGPLRTCAACGTKPGTAPASPRESRIPSSRHQL